MKKINKNILEVAVIVCFILGTAIYLFKEDRLDVFLFILISICCAIGILATVFLERIVINRNKLIQHNSLHKKDQVKILPYTQNDICVICGDYCPEGRQICINCENKLK